MNALRRILLFCLLCIFGLWAPISGQNTTFRVGVKVGLAKNDYGISDLNITSPDSFKVALGDADFSFHGGVTLQLKIRKFIFQPECLLNTARVDYRISDYPTALEKNVLSESYTNLDLPILIGYKSGPLRLMIGPVGHLHLSSTSDLFVLDSYSQQFQNMTWGWQAGMGLDFWKMTLDVRYEGNFTKFGDHIRFGSQKYSFSDAPTRLIASIGFQF